MKKLSKFKVTKLAIADYIADNTVIYFNTYPDFELQKILGKEKKFLTLTEKKNKKNCAEINCSQKYN